MSERKNAPATPGTLPMSAALDSNETLARLLQRLHESKQRFACIQPLLASELADQVRPGPLDEQGWTLLASSGAVASKLRQLLPRLEDRLRTQGWQGSAIRIRVQSN